MIMLLGTIPLQACVPPETGGSATAPNPIAYQSDIAAVRKDLVTVSEAVGKKADSARVDSLVVRIDGLSGAGQQSSYPKDQLYTKAEVDAKIAAAIEALKVAAPWGTPANPASPGNTGWTVTLERAQVISTSNETSGKDVSIIIKNGTGNAKSPSLLISLVPMSPGMFETGKLDGTHRTLKSTLSGMTAAMPGTVVSSTDVSTLLSKLYWITPVFSLGNNETKNIWLNFDVWTTDDVVTWTLAVKVLE